MTKPQYATTKAPSFLEPRDAEDRANQLNRLDAALAGADYLAGPLGHTTIDYAGYISDLRTKARAERIRLLKEMEDAT
ncbi:MAG: hypothetical protein ACR2P3_10100 [Geminicoccaceae bacterium]